MNYEKLISDALDLSKSDKTLIIFRNQSSFIIKTKQEHSYIIKGSQKDLTVVEKQKEVISQLVDEHYNLAQIFYVEKRVIDSVNYTVEVQEYVPGKPLSLDLKPREEKNIITAVFQLHANLSMIDSNAYKGQLMTFCEFFPEVVKHGKDSIFKKNGMRLLNNSLFNDIMNQDNQCIIYGDIWYQNILVDDSNKIGFIDLDPLLIGPSELQFALLVSSFFIYIYQKNNNIENFSLGKLIELWPTHIDYEKVKLLIYVYPVLVGILKISELETTQNKQRETILIKSIEVITDIVKAIDTIILDM